MGDTYNGEESEENRGEERREQNKVIDEIIE